MLTKSEYLAYRLASAKIGTGLRYTTCAPISCLCCVFNGTGLCPPHLEGEGIKRYLPVLKNVRDLVLEGKSYKEINKFLKASKVEIDEVMIKKERFLQLERGL